MLAVAFLFPMVAAAAGAAIAPVIIHLILRTKPRKIVFPAMRFVRKTHQANLSKLRLKHLLLLLLRMLAIVGAALLIARPQLERWASVVDADAPAEVVVLVDNSASMSYVHRGQTLLERGKQFARQVVESLPAGSRVAVLPTEGTEEKVSFLSDRRNVLEQLVAVEGTYGTRPIGPALRRALAMLEKAELGRREVYVVSDMTAWSWRELKALEGKGVRFIVLNCGAGEDANIALGELRLEATAVPEGVEVALQTLLRSMQVGGEVDLRVEVNDQPVDSRPVALRPGGAVALTLSFTPRQRGLAHGRVYFGQADPLAMDNVRYFTLLVGPPVGMLVVRDPATVGRGDPTSFLMSLAVASGGTATWIRRETLTADRLDAPRLREARIVLLGDVSSLSEGQWKALEGFVRGGGSVWVVIGSLLSVASYNSPDAQRVLPATFGELETLPQPAAWKAPRRSEPMLEPFTTDANPPLSEVRCDRRFRLPSLSPGANVALAYADGKPAIVTRTVGEGSVVLWNFSPAREFSNLARLAQFPILSQRTARLLAGGAGEDTMYLWGQTATVPIPRPMDSGMVTVRRPGEAMDQPVVRSLNERALTFPADRLGHWTVQFAEGSARMQRGFSVNADFAESDLAAMTEDDLLGIFPADRLVVASEMADLARLRRTVTEPLDLAVPLLLGLLILLIGESFFANRFYRQDSSQREAQEAQETQEGR